MTSKGKIERWLLADWNGGRLLKSSSMIRVTEEVNVGITESGQRADTPKTDVISGKSITCSFFHGGTSSEGRRSLKAIENDSNAGVSDAKNEGRDYSPSASSWEPSDDESSSDSASEHSLVSQKSNFTKQYSNKGKKGGKSTHSPNAIINNILKARHVNNNSINNTINRKRVHKDSIRPLSVKKYSADSTKRHHTPPIEKKNVDKNAREIQDIKAGFRELFRMLNDLKPQPKKFFMEMCPELDRSTRDTTNNNIVSEEYDDNSERSDGEDSDRSDDNVLISNKFNRVEQNFNSKQNSKCESEDEWVPIGSGKTMIHKDKFRKVNWKSYTIATRTLLLAAFPRRILATHSLTGKRSPAFQNKPPKMCLDPKIVMDIILEITSKFKVKENLVRGIITTKCADECKMFKARIQSKNKSKNNENAQPVPEEKQK
ncbi:uncharacterized protein [Epargyreus clarus]|uniref:uncharacterized protein n=1 Tax=Epargyreus clarus TaxID=520877 RepID=UPI003C2B03B0